MSDALTKENGLDVLGKAIDLGINHFMQQNYHKALKIFSKAISLAESYDEDEIIKLRKTLKLPQKWSSCKIIHPKLGSLLDHRAATYERLNDLTNSFKDCEKLIELEPFGCKGYLRMSKIFMRQGKQTKAYAVLVKGIKRVNYGIEKYNIPVSGKLLEALRRQKEAIGEDIKKDRIVKQIENKVEDKLLVVPTKRKLTTLSDMISDQLTKKQSPAVIYFSKDPLEKLPLELIRKIFKYLPFQSISSCVLVSKIWYEIITSFPELFEDIQLKRQISASAFKKLYKILSKSSQNRTFKRINRLKIYPKRQEEKSILNTLMNFTKLQILNLEIYLSDINLRDLFLMIRESKLARFNFSNLETLRLEIPLLLEFEEFFIDLLPKLSVFEIVISEITKIKNQSDAKKISDNLKTLKDEEDRKLLYKNLKCLSIVMNPSFSTNVKKLPFERYFLDKKLPNLETLTIAGFNFKNFNQEFVKSFIQNLSNLKHLVLEHNDGLTIQDLILNFSKWKEYDYCLENDIKPITKISSNLQTLYVREPSITSVQHLRLVSPSALIPFKNIVSLDITGSSLSFEALIKILANLNHKGSRFKSLSIGMCQFIVWQSSAFDRYTSGGHVDFAAVLRCCPKLERLSLNQSSNLNDFSLASIGRAYLEAMALQANHEDGKKEFILDRLDLSFNSISGHGLIELFQINHKMNISLIESGNNPVFRVNKLIIDGIDFKVETLKLLEKRGYVSEIQCNLTKARWREYGVNSILPF
ncbi:hypothetical protein PACTADRAFT_34518 [Pachysolen tannophilus NRRL Y-2460]|uniref:F-box domain-containing protein n=1 Tax=Pachysolen tannophilus NRRL Y-2460 TaxID=669874 RepID=A0A1E4TSR2_PACTA|nr:hypothetical protein PACTADRAFT_34518 [Pachysolen tannophilus NRRL Y-2460]